MAREPNCKRYEHYLAASKPSPWPDAVLCVGCSVRWSACTADGRTEKLTLSSWHGVLLVRHGDGFAVARRATGTTADGFWDMVRTMSQRSKRPWIISSCFRVEAAAVGLWEAMENGSVQIAGRDSRHGTHRQNRVRHMSTSGGRIPGQTSPVVHQNPLSAMPPVLDTDKSTPLRGQAGSGGKRQGICILADPPIVLQLALGDGGSIVTWVDAANYGIDTQSGVTNGEESSRQVSEWMLHATRTIADSFRAGWQSTAASQAAHIFRCRYLDQPILSHTHLDAERLESAALYGGRCEPFALGRLTFGLHLYDIRSMYPYLMAESAVPTRLAGYSDSATVDQLRRTNDTYCCMADVAIETDTADYPYRRGEAAIYPVGRFWTVLTGVELDHALDAGVVRGVRRVAWYKQDRALERYARDLYAFRQAADTNGDKIGSDYVKRLMVALPGKFAQRVASWEDMPDAECPWEWAEWYRLSDSGEPERWRVIAGRIQREQRGGFSYGAVPAITAAICAAGRMRLLAAMNAAGREHVYYCDTDAIMVDDYGAENLVLAEWVRPGEWGWMQHVESADNAELHGVKRYRIGDRVREAGRPLAAKSGLMGDDAGMVQPWIGDSLRKQQPPADWRVKHGYQRGPGRYEASRDAGGLVRPIEIAEW